MIDIGVYNELTILRSTSVGLYLGDEQGEDVLLPNKYCPEEYEVGDKIDVFVYLDYAERKVATNIDPKIKLHEFALLKTTSVENVGAFMDWGLEKELMVPFKEQRQNMEEGRWYVVYLDIDEKTDRLYASNKIEKRLQNEDLTVEQGDEVDLLVYTKSDLGYSLIINNKHKGLVFDNEVFKELNIGDKLKGYVKEIREDNKIDISLAPVGYANYNDVNANRILDKLNQNEGFIGINDKSSPHEIYDEFGISKKAFKKAAGALYKNRDISIEAKGIRLNK
ncbi:MAG: S1-like domain-containing RNA-binding protein [Crocinitomicaceae bacterium]|nr:S1-like domain-containing RNA-binding protein [Crocinitomicaceae bacterium]